MSDVHVSVQWKSSAVFAGEDLECIITFKNVSQAYHVQSSSSPHFNLRGQSTARERWKESLPHHGPSKSIGHTRNNSISKSDHAQETSSTHWPSSYLASPVDPRHSIGTAEAQSAKGDTKHERHRRSVSIVSLGNDVHQTQNTRTESQTPTVRRPGKGHARAASLQVLPWRSGVVQNGPTSTPANGRMSTLPSPLLRASTSVGNRTPSPSTDISKSPNLGQEIGATPPRVSRTPSNSFSSNYRFPNVPAAIPEGQAQNTLGQASRSISSHPKEAVHGHSHTFPVTKVPSTTSIEGTPRSSLDFYSMSNNSTETLASECIHQDRARQHLRSAHSRQMSSLNPNKPPRLPETLMMGYGHITGSFTLDASLVNQGAFEEVKKKAIVGDLGGGGVVRVESTKRNSGLFGFSGWGNIGESLGGLLGGGELSSIKESKSSGNARSIPILSTPQSVLFVDLQLAPGESKSYCYKHILPRGIPPSHKGRAMRIAYNLVVGSQRAGTATHKHSLQHVEIPFRVLPGVNAQGDTLGHDLMSPHIFLRDEARIRSVEKQQKGKPWAGYGTDRKGNSSSQDFLTYVETMLERRRQSSGFGLLSPSETGYRSFMLTSEEPKSMKEAIDFAILKCNLASSSKRGANRFEISRGGDRIAAIMLARPAYRLGETIPVVLTFDESDIPCYSLRATLESSETVDAAIALRSKASIQRATRWVHASHTESTIFARRVVFNPVIPMSSTPEFLTSGVSLEWKLRFEFVTHRLREGEEPESGLDDLMEDLAQDERSNERGSIAAGVQMMPCETFDMTIPLQVYGATAAFDEMYEVGDYPI